MKIKNDPNNLPHLLNVSLLVICGHNVWLTADVHDPEEYIYIPLDGERLLECCISKTVKATVALPDGMGKQQCVIMENDNFITKNDLTYVDGAETWAYYGS